MSEPKGYEQLSVAGQKQILKQKFADAGWEAPRILAVPDADTDIYFDSISQLIAPRWSAGRCAMTGDAAFCPSPLSGMGASLSMVGAYVLAGELSSHSDHTRAFAAYEKRLRPYVNQTQKLPPGVPYLAHPSSKIGITLFNTVLRVISSSVIQTIGALLSGKKNHRLMMVYNPRIMGNTQTPDVGFGRRFSQTPASGND